MFYKKEDVESALICTFCSNIFKDPRLLPCGISACHECILSRCDLNKQFTCLSCDEEHQPTNKEGIFYPNKSLVKIITANAREVSRGPSVESLKSKLVEIKMMNEELKANLDNGVDQVRDHCVKLRNDVHLKTEILIEQIHQLNEELIKEIDDYEKKCIESYKKNLTDKRADFFRINNQIEQFLR
jgi:hypothetical protein